MSFGYIKYLSPFVSVMAIAISLYAGGVWAYFAPVYAFILIPFFELFLDASVENMDKAEEEIARKDWRYDLMVWSIVPVQFLMMSLFLYRVSQPHWQWWEVLGFILAYGISCGVFGINVAHELGHRAHKGEQLLSKALLLTSLYMHFFIEHNRGHHKNVSTDDDPASSRRGETLYAFWVRSMVNSWLHAWRLESDRLSKLGLSSVTLRNEMLVYQLIQLALVTCIGLLLGWNVMLLFVISAIIGGLLLETVNYIEHYGLRRKKVEDAYYEKVMPVHSWNSNHPIGRLMLFELSRHSDHHYMASRKYQILRHFDEAPQMPTGYPGMMVLSTFPPLWFKVMHAEIERFKTTPQGAALA